MKLIKNRTKYINEKKYSDFEFTRNQFRHKKINKIYNLSSQVEDLKISSKLIFNFTLNFNPLKSQFMNLNSFDQLLTIKLNLSLTTF